MNRTTFITNFTIQFLASYAASIYNESCFYGTTDRLVDLPYEDAVDIAKDVYEKTMKEINKEVGR